MGKSGDLGIPPLVLSRFVLDHLANLPPARELVRNEPLPPMDIDNLVVRRPWLTLCHTHTHTHTTAHTRIDD
jgi:K+-sensing histidine kinase KdpD